MRVRQKLGRTQSVLLNVERTVLVQLRPNDGKDKQVRQLKTAMAERDVPVRSSLGQAFDSWLKQHPEEKDKYSRMKETGNTYQMKRAFRLKWAQKMLDECTYSVRSELQEWQMVDTDIGTYEPVEMIIKHEGGKDSDAACRAAATYVKKAMQMGGRPNVFLAAKLGSDRARSLTVFI